MKQKNLRLTIFCLLLLPLALLLSGCPNFMKGDELKNAIQEEIKTRFDEEGIEIPFPHLSLYRGEATRPFPVEIVASGAGRSGDS